MAQEGFIFDELSDFKKDLLRSIKEDYPKETKKFLKKSAGKITKIAKKIAQREVKKDTGNYLKSFKSGKIYDYSGDTCCRAYNSAPHGHLIEYGHVNVPRGASQKNGGGASGKGGKGVGYTAGKFIFKKAELESMSEFFNDCESFLGEFFDKTTER